jgi:hypothetical protein
LNERSGASEGRGGGTLADPQAVDRSPAFRRRPAGARRNPARPRLAATENDEPVTDVSTTPTLESRGLLVAAAVLLIAGAALILRSQEGKQSGEKGSEPHAGKTLG